MSTAQLLIICVTAIILYILQAAVRLGKSTDEHQCVGGPPGPVGPMGVQGPPGPGCDGPCCRDVGPDKDESGPTRRSPWPPAV